jgi:hypothetical protein
LHGVQPRQRMAPRAGFEVDCKRLIQKSCGSPRRTGTPRYTPRCRQRDIQALHPIWLAHDSFAALERSDECGDLRTFTTQEPRAVLVPPTPTTCHCARLHARERTRARARCARLNLRHRGTCRKHHRGDQRGRKKKRWTIFSGTVKMTVQIHISRLTAAQAGLVSND